MIKEKSYRQLFIASFYVSAFTFGGGYVIVPMMQKKFVNELQWIEEKEMMDLIAIAQALPGVMAVNTSIIVGNKLFGLKGSLISCVGTILPSFIVLTIISFFYEMFKGNEHVEVILNGMQSAAAALIISAALTLFIPVIKENKVLNSILFLISFCLAFILKISVIYIIIAALILFILVFLLTHRKKGDKS